MTKDALHDRVYALAARLGKPGNAGNQQEMAELLAECRQALSALPDDGLGPMESPELECAFHVASSQNLMKFALLWALTAIDIADISQAICDTGFYNFLA